MGTRSTKNFDKLQATCGVKGHSYETIDYLPDPSRHCYGLKLQCARCESLVFENINRENEVCNYDYPTLSVLKRYWRDADRVFYCKKQQTPTIIAGLTHQVRKGFSLEGSLS